VSGSTGSGQDIESGRANYANSPTNFWAERPTPPSADFNSGPHQAIFVVEPAPVASNPDAWDPPENWAPQNPVNAIVGIGTSGITVAPFNGVGGVGVVGFGGNARGAGVHGAGGAGGPGVEAIGGNEDGPIGLGTGDPPGAGVLAQGGKNLQSSFRRPPGPGVAALAGGRPAPPLTDMKGAGVFAHGADGTAEKDPTDPSRIVGPRDPGVGVVGIGGVFTDKSQPEPVTVLGAGVVGVAARVALPQTGATAGTGVFGTGPTFGVHGVGVGGEGVRGSSDRQPGVRGDSTQDRGGVFANGADTAQLRLVPHRQNFSAPETQQTIPQGIPTDQVRISGNGLAGDLMALMDPSTQIATLWFCIRSTQGGAPARWAQVLLGNPVNGV